MTILRYTYFGMFLYLFAFLAQAQVPYPFQASSPVSNFAWDENDTSRYTGHYRFEYAYRLVEDMLNDQRPLNFAEAVFAVENCMYDGLLEQSSFLDELERIATGIENMVDSGYITAPSRDMALNYAIYVFFTQPCPLNHNQPFTYDSLSFVNDVGLTGGMLSNLLKTGRGTCHSLPYLYKIIADKVGAKAYIAVAPLHMYIRHQDASGTWWNFETTTGTYSHSSFIMENFHVSEAAIRSGLYMTNLTDKETIVQCLYDLLCIYERKSGFYSNKFVRKCYTLGLKYHYPDILHSKRINDLKYQLDKKAWLQGLRSDAEIREDSLLSAELNYIQQQIMDFEAMGYHAYTPEEYMQKYKETIDYLQRKNSK